MACLDKQSATPALESKQPKATPDKRKIRLQKERSPHAPPLAQDGILYIHAKPVKEIDQELKPKKGDRKEKEKNIMAWTWLFR